MKIANRSWLKVADFESKEKAESFVQFIREKYAHVNRGKEYEIREVKSPDSKETFTLWVY